MWKNRPRDDEREIERLFREAHEIPVEPMDDDKIREVLRHVSAQQQESVPFPAHPFVFMAACLLVAAASVLASGNLPAARAAVVLLLVSNVGLSPLTAIAIAWRRRRQYES